MMFLRWINKMVMEASRDSCVKWSGNGPWMCVMVFRWKDEVVVEASGSSGLKWSGNGSWMCLLVLELNGLWFQSAANNDLKSISSYQKAIGDFLSSVSFKKQRGLSVIDLFSLWASSCDLKEEKQPFDVHCGLWRPAVKIVMAVVVVVVAIMILSSCRE